MKTVLVIGSRNTGTKNNPETIARHLATDETNVVLAYWEELVFSVKTGAVKVFNNEDDLRSLQPDLVIAVGWYKNGKESQYRDVAYSLALYLDHADIPYWNSEMGQQRSTSKLSCMVQLALEGVPVPETHFSLDRERVDSYLDFPYIAKAASASRGDNNYLVEDDGTVQKIKQSDAYFMVQPFLPNDHDLRVICFGGTPRLVLRRARTADAETHMNNTSQGGRADWIELSQIAPGVLTLCEKIAKITHREMAGIDLIPDASSPLGYSCLEVNAVPQLTSGTDTDKKLSAFSRAVQES